MLSRLRKPILKLFYSLRKGRNEIIVMTINEGHDKALFGRNAHFNALNMQGAAIFSTVILSHVPNFNVVPSE